MLSRLAARTGSLASRSFTRAAAPSLVRTFKNMPIPPLHLFHPVPASAAPAAAAGESPVQIINKYGTTSFWGMVAAIMVSKEIFILDAEFLLSLEISAFVMTAYVLTGDTLTKMSEAADLKEKTQFEGGSDFMIEMFNQYKLQQSTVQCKPDVLRQYSQEYKEAIEAHAKFMTVKPQHEARAQVMTALEQIRVKEQHASAMEWQETIDKAVANVRAAFATQDAKLNQEMVDLAIKNIGFGKLATTEADDPVKRLFLKEFN